MDKKMYIKYRNENNSGVILYEYYQTFFDKSKHNKMLDYPEFVRYFNMWEFQQLALNDVIEYFDCKFNVTKIWKNNQLIKVI